MKKILLAIGPSPEIGGAQKVYMATLEGFLRGKNIVHVVVTRGPLLDCLSHCDNVVLHIVNYSSLFAYLDIYRILKNRQFEIINTYSMKCSLLFSLVNLFFGNVICCTLLNAITHEKLNRVEKLIYPFIYFLLSKICDGIIVNSEQNKRHFIETAKITSDKIKVIYSGIKTERFNNSFKNRSKTSKIFIGVIGRLSVEKGHKYFIDALPLLQGMEYDCLIVGEGPLRAELEAQVRINGLQGKVTFLGFQEDIPKVMKTLDVVVLPSINETFGITIVEAFASKKIVIASNVGGIPELVKNAETGYLVPAKDPVAIAEALIHIYRNPSEIERIVENAYMLALKSFTDGIMIKNTLEYYDFLLQKASHGRSH